MAWNENSTTNAREFLQGNRTNAGPKNEYFTAALTLTLVQLLHTSKEPSRERLYAMYEKEKTSLCILLL